MKKILVITSLFIIVFLVFIIITKEKPQKLEIVFTDQLEIDYHETIKACVLRPDGKLVLIDVKKENNENIYIYIIKLYDHYRNSLPLTYTSPLNGNFEVLKLEKQSSTLNIEIKAMHIGEHFNNFLTALMWTYQNIGIDKVNLKVNDELYNLEKNNRINVEIDSTSIYNTTEQLVIFYNDEEIMPVTYYHNENPVDFLLKKVTSKYSHVTYTYEIFNNNLYISMLDPEFLVSKNVVQTVLVSLERLETYKDIVIIKNGIVVANN